MKTQMKVTLTREEIQDMIKRWVDQEFGLKSNEVKVEFIIRDELVNGVEIEFEQ